MTIFFIINHWNYFTEETCITFHSFAFFFLKWRVLYCRKKSEQRMLKYEWENARMTSFSHEYSLCTAVLNSEGNWFYRIASDAHHDWIWIVKLRKKRALKSPKLTANSCSFYKLSIGLTYVPENCGEFLFLGDESQQQQKSISKRPKGSTRICWFLAAQPLEKH